MLLALDLGTSTAKAAAWREGVLVASARRPLASAFPAPGHVEQDPDEIAATARAVLEEIARALAPGETASVGITCQRSTVILWDAEDGRALGPALTWRDARATDEARALEHAVPDLTARTGLPTSPHYGAPKIAWALSHWPAARRAAAAGRLRVGPVSTWATWCLSEGRAFRVDGARRFRS